MNILDRILAVTEEVERLVERGDWAAATALDEERRRLLETLVAGPDGADERQDFLEALLARNEGMIGRLGERRRTTLAAAAHELHAGPGAARAYAANSAAGTARVLRLVSGGEPS